MIYHKFNINFEKKKRNYLERYGRKGDIKLTAGKKEASNESQVKTSRKQSLSLSFSAQGPLKELKRKRKLKISLSCVLKRD
jgi:hypothetical protein